jgi:sec-independent protein translocase protein TatA
MFGLSPFELMVVGVVAVLLFGAKLPEVARSLGSSYHQFKRGMSDIQGQFRVAEMEAKRPFESIKKDFEDDEEERPASSAPKFTPPSSSDQSET